MEPGDRVGIMLPNVPYFGAVYYGILRAGGVVVPMNVLLKGREVAFYLTRPRREGLFAWHGFEEAATTGAAEAGTERDPGRAGQVRAARDGGAAGARRTSRARTPTPP